MAFDANIVSLRVTYNDDLYKQVISCLNTIMKGNFSIEIRKAITFDEYIRNSASRPINRYIRIPVKIFKKIKGDDSVKEDEGKEINVKYGQGVVEASKFANSKHFVLSICALEKNTLIWFNFHPELYKHIQGFNNVQNMLARQLSISCSTEAVYMQTTSKSRSDAKFVMYSRGFVRGEETGKDSLTVLKNDYGIDINKCMDSIDNNIAIYYAPFDYANINKSIYEQKVRFEQFNKSMKNVIIENKDDGNNMVEKFTQDNETIMKSFTQEKSRIEAALSAKETGTLYFYELNTVVFDRKTNIIKESHFGGRRKSL